MTPEEQARLLDRWNEVDASMALLRSEPVTEENDAVYDRLESEAKAIRKQIDASIFAADREEDVDYDHRLRMTELTELFPTLRGAPGVRPWDQHKLDEWVCSGAGTSGSRRAVQFLLMVWSGTNKGVRRLTLSDR